MEKESAYKRGRRRLKNVRGFVIILSIILLITFLLLFYFFSRQGIEDEILYEEPRFPGENDYPDINDFGIHAIVINDVSFCDLLNDSVQECKDEFYFYRTLVENKNYCDKMSRDEDGANELCLILFNSEDRCGDLPLDSQTICNVILGKDTVRACNNIVDEENGLFCKDLFYMVDSLNKKDSRPCKKISEDRSKELCNGLIESI